MNFLYKKLTTPPHYTLVNFLYVTHAIKSHEKIDLFQLNFSHNIVLFVDKIFVNFGK